MAFQISAQGSRKGVIAHIQAAKATPENSDQSQIEAVKALLEAEINALPAEFNGVQVSASGDAHKGGRSLQVTVIPQKIHLDPS